MAQLIKSSELTLSGFMRDIMDKVRLYHSICMALRGADRIFRFMMLLNCCRSCFNATHAFGDSLNLILRSMMTLPVISYFRLVLAYNL